MSLEYSCTLVLKDVSTGVVETRISKLQNQEAKSNKNSQKQKTKTEEMKERNH